jgi:hypothetical protein
MDLALLSYIICGANSLVVILNFNLPGSKVRKVGQYGLNQPLSYKHPFFLGSLLIIFICPLLFSSEKII